MLCACLIRACPNPPTPLPGCPTQFSARLSGVSQSGPRADCALNNTLGGGGCDLTPPPPPNRHIKNITTCGGGDVIGMLGTMRTPKGGGEAVSVRTFLLTNNLKTGRRSSLTPDIWQPKTPIHPPPHPTHHHHLRQVASSWT